jgi:type VI secretion system protein ImpJ
MSFIDKVIWTEGMFLQPQHFQQHDRYLESLIFQRPGFIESYNWGITELKIDEHLLALGKFSIAICRGILPDGTPFDIPTRDKAPLPIDIPPGLTHSEIFLALSLKRAGTPETGNSEDKQPAWRYAVETIEVSDNNAFSDLVTSVQVGKLALQLMLEKEDRQGFSCLGIARVLEVRADRTIILDERHLPPCIDVQAVDQLAHFIQEIQGLLHYRGNTLVQRLTEAGSGGVAEIADFMLLQLVNRYEPLLAHLAHLRGLHPEYLYRLLLQLMGELSTFTSRQRRPGTAPLYLQDNLQDTFEPIIAELRRALSLVLEESAVALKIEQQPQLGTWTSPLLDKTLLSSSYFILAVHANLPPESIRHLFPAQTKIAPVEEIRNLVNRALPGIELRPLPVAPRQIPYHSNFTYFALNRDHPLWRQLENSAALAFHIGGNFPDLRLELWAVKEK